MREFDVPVIVTVRVRVDDDGTVDAWEAYVDPGGGPWAYCDDALAYEAENDEGGCWFGQMQEHVADDDVERAWEAAIDALHVNVEEVSDGNDA